jgi:hypothetical protein
MFGSLRLARFSGEIPSRFCDFSRRYGQEHFRPAFAPRSPWRSVAGHRHRFQFCIERFQSTRRLFLQLFPNCAEAFARIYVISICYTEFILNIYVIFSQLVSRSRARSAARPCTTSCGFAAFEAIPFPGADSIFPSRCGAISGRLRQPLAPRSRRPKRLGSKDRRSTRRSTLGAGAGTA